MRKTEKKLLEFSHSAVKNTPNTYYSYCNKVSIFFKYCENFAYLLFHAP